MGSAPGEPSQHPACWGAELPPALAGSSQHARGQRRVRGPACQERAEKGKTLRLPRFVLEITSLSGMGRVSFLLNWFVSYRTATPPRLSSWQSGCFASSPGGMEIHHYSELFPKCVLFISSPTCFCALPSGSDRQVCEVEERGAGWCWWNRSRRGRSQHRSGRELPAGFPFLPHSLQQAGGGRLFAMVINSSGAQKAAQGPKNEGGSLQGRAGARQTPLMGAGPSCPQPAPKTSVSSPSFWGRAGLFGLPRLCCP